jgi:hypothetical protein
VSLEWVLWQPPYGGGVILIQAARLFVEERLAHQHLGGPLVVVWDGLNTHGSAAMAYLVAARDRLTVFRLPPYAHELNPVWSLLTRPLANLLAGQQHTGILLFHDIGRQSRANPSTGLMFHSKPPGPSWPLSLSY